MRARKWFGAVAFLVISLCLFLGTGVAQAASAEKKAVVLAVFGTSHESALPGILNIRAQI